MIALWLLACGPKEVPPHLRPDAPTAPHATSGPATSLHDLVGADPLVRRPEPRLPDDWSTVAFGESIEAWATVARSESPTAADWAALEVAWPNTPVPALARGAQLAALEVAIASVVGPEDLAATQGWLGVAVEAAPPAADARGPLAWIGPNAGPETLLTMAERRVLLAWLQSPAIPLDSVADAMQPGVHDRLIDSPPGAIIRHRAAGDRNPGAAADGRTALTRATTAALQATAADSDAEQKAWIAAKQQLQTELELEAQEDPVAALLAQARNALVLDAADNGSAALALVAWSAERLGGSCPDQPCVGLDRTAVLADAAQWSEESPPVARTWQVIAVKRATDTFEVTHDRSSFGAGIAGMADALAGTTSDTVELSLLRQRSASPAALLALSRLANGPDSTEVETTKEALRSHLVRVCDQALATDLSPEFQGPIERIRRRALPRP